MKPIREILSIWGWSAVNQIRHSFETRRMRKGEEVEIIFILSYLSGRYDY